MAEPRPDSAPACEYLNVHEDAVAQVLAALPDDETLYDLSELFRVFGDSTRIKILYVLFESELCVCDIARLLNLTQSAVSHQLRILKASNLVRFRREGKTVRLTGQNGVRYTVPQYLDPEAMEETVTVRFRVGKPYRDADLAVYLDGRLLRRVHKRILSPGEMEQLTLRRADLPRGLKQITIQVEEGAQ